MMQIEVEIEGMNDKVLPLRSSTLFIFFILLAILVVTPLKSMVLNERRVLVNEGIWLIQRLIF
jgi:F0F1-type ATP synthase membrane subunit b/b'